MTYVMFFLLLLALILITHFVRTWAFNRHEAVTFESSAITTLFALMGIWCYGANCVRIAVLAAFAAMFVLNALLQWHFFLELQDVINNAFKKRFEEDNPLKKKLQTMASVAIMPSFSRFIEESKLFNNPGSMIGLIKSIMKRQRFLKKKYQMRECFAENLNLIGPCKPEIDEMLNDSVHVVPSAIHANRLALGYKSEIKGLISYDVLGFGAHILLTVMLVYYLRHPQAAVLQNFTPETLIWVALSVLAFIALGFYLRRIGFARNESVFYEFSYTGMLVVIIRVGSLVLAGKTVTDLQWSLLSGYCLLFVLVSHRYKSLNKAFHGRINLLFDYLIYNIPIETETDRTQRRFLSNLKIICEWTIEPFSGIIRGKEWFRFRATGKWEKFEKIMDEKKKMPELTADLIRKVLDREELSILADEAVFSLPSGDTAESEVCREKKELRQGSASKHDIDRRSEYLKKDRELEQKIRTNLVAVRFFNWISVAAFFAVFFLIGWGIL